MSHKEAVHLLHILNKASHPTRLVGGCVRDMLMKIPPKDFDLATSALPNKVEAILTAQGFKVIPTGIEHGTVTVVGQQGHYEITTLRQDIKTDGRHAEVQFGTSFELDAARRDFTMNAMSMDGDGTLFDYYGGERDLQAKRIQFVGDPKARIEEDYLRILRFFRFQARFNFATDPGTEATLRDCKSGLARLTQERITSELRLILSTEAPHLALEAMARLGIWALLLPALSPDAFGPAWVSLATDVGQLPEAERFTARLSAAIYQSLNDTQLEEFAKKHKFSNQELYRLQSLVLKSPNTLSHPPLQDRATCMEFIDAIEKKTGEGYFVRVWLPFWTLYLRRHPDSAELALGSLRLLAQVEDQFSQLRKATPPISGHDILEAYPGVTHKTVGELLGRAKRLYRNGEAQDKPQILAKLQES